MMRRLARPYALVGLVAALFGAVGAVTVRIADPVPVVQSTFGFSDIALLSFGFLGTAFASVGALLVVRRPENAVGWCLVLIGACYGLSGLSAAVTYSAMADGPGGVSIAGFTAWLTVLFTSIGGLLFVIGFIFPTGRGHTPGWDRAIRVGALAAPLIVVVVFLIRPGRLHTFQTIDNPFGVGPDLRPLFGPDVSSVIAASSMLFVPVLVWSIASRYRMSDAVGRQQLKWFVLALFVSLGAVALTSVGAAVSDSPPEVGLAVFGFAGALVPVAIGIAILRHGLYDIDRIISRSLGYAAITGVLAAVFTSVVLLVGALFASLTQGLIPSSQGQTIAVAVSTLVVFALFQPVRQRVQREVDRRFDRARFDADQTVRAFSGRLRDDVDLETISEEIVVTATTAVRPSRAAVWLREAHR